MTRLQYSILLIGSILLAVNALFIPRTYGLDRASEPGGSPTGHDRVFVFSDSLDWHVEVKPLMTTNNITHETYPGGSQTATTEAAFIPTCRASCRFPC